MRKLFFLIPAMLLSLAMSADPIVVDPGTKAIYYAYKDAPDGAVLVLRAGDYDETERLIFNKSVTIKAEDNAEVTIYLSKDNQIKEGAKVTFDGVTIDGSSMGSYSYIFRSYDDSEGKEIHFNNCEVKNCSKDYFFCALYVGSDKRLMDSCVIDGCHFHNMTAGRIIAVNGTDAADKVACKGIAIRNSYFENCANSAVYVSKSTVEGTESCNSVIVKNSTFAGFSALDHSVIDVNNYGNTQASTIEVNVDHCTFYNNTIPNGYGCIRSSKSTNLTISNCIFAHIDPIDRYATYCYGGTITNCLVHNLTKGHRTETGFAPANNIVANPYFLNVEYGSYDFTLAPTSPARNAGTGDSNIGDPRWNTDYSGRSTTKNITATSNALKNAIDAAWPGDVIILADGEYTQGDNYTVFDKSLLIKAADDASPVIKFTVPARLKQGARAEFNGIKFDMADLHGQSWYEHLISAEDDSDGNKLIFEKCEFYNDAANNSTIYCASNKKLDSLVVNNCKFYNSHKSCIFLENAGLIGLNVTNSTFANITSEDGSYYAGVIDMRSTTGSLRIDHCTFYNVQAMNTDYAAIGKVGSSDAIVSNCIFAMPSSTANLRAIRDVAQANNCLTFNYTKDNNWGIHDGVTKTDCIKEKDPLFVDATNSDFKLHIGSPAIGVGTNASDLGDPNWSKVAVPSTDFTDPLVLIGADAILANRIELTENWSLKSKNQDKEGHEAEFGTATWTFNTTKASAVQVTINMDPSAAASGHNYQVEIFDDNNASQGALAEGDWFNNIDDKLLSGMIYLPKAGEYTVVLSNSIEWSSAVAKGITLSYIEGGDVVEIPNALTVADAWFTSKGTRADGMITFSTYNGQWVKWNATLPGTVKRSYEVSLNIYSPSEYGHRFSVAFYEEDGAEPIYTLTESSWNGSYGTPLAISMGNVVLEGGKNYIVKVTNAENGAQPKIVSVTFTYQGGAIQTIATDANTTLAVADALYSGCTRDENKTYIQYPSSGTSSAWIKWNIATTETKHYDLTVNVNTEYAHGFTVAVYEDEDAEPVASVTEGSYINTKGVLALEIGRINLAGGKNYVVKVTNAPSGSQAKVLDVVFAPVVATVTALPGTLEFNNAVLSPNAHVKNSMLYFNEIGDTNPQGEWAQWEVTTDHDGAFLFTMGVESTNGQSYKITLLDGENHTIAVKEQDLGSGTKTMKHFFELAAGNYFVKVENTKSYSKGHLTSLTVTEPDILLIDENATTNTVIVDNYRTGAMPIRINRTIIPGMYNTICLPFDVDDNQLKSVFGDNIELLQMSGATIDGAVLTLDFEPTSSIYRGTPYLIKTAAEVVNPIFTDVEIKEKVGQATDGTDAEFRGIFIQTTLEADYDLFLGQNNILHFPSSTSAPLKGLRAYFHISAANAQAIKRARIVTQEQVITEIDLVNGENNGVIKTIENGQLIINLDGIRYNIMGGKIK